MTTTYSLAPMPKWYIADLTGEPLGAGYMFTYSSLNKTLQKLVYQDPAGAFAWTDPIRFDENGSQGPFYWEFDSADPTDLYYIEVYDRNMVLQWTIDNFTPPGASSGGGTVTTAIDLKNYVTNNIAWRNIGTVNPITSAAFKIALGAHAGLAQTPANYGPDIWFIKSNTSATDQLSFPLFTPLGVTPLTGDVTPYQYINYQCSVVGSAETAKYIQFPITRNVQNLSNQPMTVSIWARCNSGTATLRIYWAQFFGDGAGASTPVQTLINTISLTSSWAKYTVTANVPSVSTKVLGGCGNDGLFLQIAYPTGALTNIDFTKPCAFLGQTIPSFTYETNDQIDAVINSPRTGYITQGYDLVAPYGYLLMDDLTIGSASSTATSNPISGGVYLGRSIDTFPLFNWLWTNVSQPSGNTLCPVSGGLGATAVADFTANKTITLQSILGRALASAGLGSGLTSRSLGSITGTETHSLILAELAAHTHTFHSDGQFFKNAPSAFFSTPGSGQEQQSNEVTGTTDSTGSGQAFSIMQPSSFLNFYIKL